MTQRQHPAPKQATELLLYHLGWRKRAARIGHQSFVGFARRSQEVCRKALRRMLKPYAIPVRTETSQARTQVILFDGRWQRNAQ
jgi:hypothetical protein